MNQILTMTRALFVRFAWGGEITPIPSTQLCQSVLHQPSPIFEKQKWGMGLVGGFMGD